MRILQVLTLLSRNGEFGGPSTVAVNQCRALADRGHQVTLVAGALAADADAAIPGVELHTFTVRTLGPGPSFTRICSPAMLRWIHAHIGRFDVAHVHLSRDFVTLPAARLLIHQRIPTHVQTHGMINPRRAWPYRVLDRGLTVPAVTGAATAFYLNEVERNKLGKAIDRTARYAHLINGVPNPPKSPDVSGPATPEVVFLARLHPRKRPVTFAHAAARLAPQYNARFTVIGPDEGEGDLVDAVFRAARTEHPGIAQRLRRSGPLETAAVSSRLAEASIYVLPSVDEPLPMSVLEAMAAGLPVIVTDTCGFADLVVEADAGIVVDDSIESLTAAIEELLREPVRARERGRRGQRAVQEHWSITSVAQELEKHYALSTTMTGASHRERLGR